MNQSRDNRKGNGEKNGSLTSPAEQTCGCFSKFSMRLSKDNLNNSIFGSFTSLSIFLVADLMRVLLSSRVPRNCNINIMHMIRIVYEYNWKSNQGSPEGSEIHHVHVCSLHL